MHLKDILSRKLPYSLLPSLNSPSKSSVKDYIGFFEPLVVHAVQQFSYTSSILMQQRVLFLLVQLLQLKVDVVNHMWIT